MKGSSSFWAILVKQGKQVCTEKEMYKKALPNGYQSWFQFCLRLVLLVLEFCKIPLYPQVNACFGKKEKEKLACHICHSRDLTNIERVQSSLNKPQIRELRDISIINGHRYWGGGGLSRGVAGAGGVNQEKVDICNTLNY